MRTILLFIRKEFLQIFRNKGMLPIIFIMPIIQLLILSNAADFEIKNIRTVIVDFDQSSLSRGLTQKILHNDHFNVVANEFSEKTALKWFDAEKARLILRIPRGFEKSLMKQSSVKVQLLINAIDGAAAGVIFAYTTSLLATFNKQVTEECFNFYDLEPNQSIHIEPSYWFNPELNYKTYMVPGILVLLITMVGAFLSGMNIVREKEIGTIEQINVTPIRKYQFVIGKLLPFWFLALFELSFGLAIAKLVFNIPIVGSLGVIYLFASVYLILILGIGLFISTLADTQQQAMFLAWFTLIVFILLSGLFTPIEAMPEWAQRFTEFNPVAYFVRVIRMVMLKGAGLAEIWKYLLFLFGYAVIVLGLATWRYRKTAV